MPHMCRVATCLLEFEKCPSKMAKLFGHTNDSLGKDQMRLLVTCMQRADHGNLWPRRVGSRLNQEPAHFFIRVDQAETARACDSFDSSGRTILSANGPRSPKHSRSRCCLRIACVFSVRLVACRAASFCSGDIRRATHSRTVHRSRPCVARRRRCLSLKSGGRTNAKLFGRSGPRPSSQRGRLSVTYL
jgi:hypothetical protein